jgi:hypothetical protein
MRYKYYENTPQIKRKKLLRMVWHTFVAMAILALVSGVIPSISSVPIVQAATKIKLNKTKATLYVGDTLKLKVSGTSKTVTWSSSNEKVAVVSAKGKVTAKNGGNATITAKVGEKKYTCKVNVKKCYSSSVAILPENIQVDTLSYISDSYYPENKVQIVDYSIIGDKIYLTYKIVEAGNPKGTSFSAYIYQYDSSNTILGSILIYTSDATIGATFRNYYYLKDNVVRIGTGVDDNIKILKQFINQNGDTNAEGNKLISYKPNEYTYVIVYNEQNDELQFIVASSSYALTMVMKSEDNTSTLQVDYTFTNGKSGFPATGYIEPATYTSNQSVSFTLAKSLFDTEKDLQNACNSLLRLGFTGWEHLLLTKLGMDLNNIGFTSYQ